MLYVCNALMYACITKIFRNVHLCDDDWLGCIRPQDLHRYKLTTIWRDKEVQDFNPQIIFKQMLPIFTSYFYLISFNIAFVFILQSVIILRTYLSLSRYITSYFLTDEYINVLSYRWAASLQIRKQPLILNKVVARRRAPKINNSKTRRRLSIYEVFICLTE